MEGKQFRRGMLAGAVMVMIPVAVCIAIFLRYYFKFNLKLNLNDSYLKNKGILDEWCKLIDEGKLEDVKFRIYVEKENNGEYKSIYPQEYVEFSISDTIDPVGIEHFHLSEYN